MRKKVDSPNHTQVPNEFLDSIMPQIDTASELKVTIAIIRATFGWHKDEDALSITQLIERTGSPRSSVLAGLKAALKRGYVQRRPHGTSYLYNLSVQNLDSPDPDPPGGPNPGPPDEIPGVEGGPRSGPTKENQLPKEKTAKENARPEVERLCQLMADLSNVRTDPEGTRPKPKYVVTDTWRDEMRRLIDIDGRSEKLIERAIRWVDQDSFWRKNVLAVPKLREKFDQLYLAAQKQRGGSSTKAGRIDENVRKLREGAKS